MALIPTINVCVKTACSVLTFKETTGTYNVTTNPGGYGTPNPITGDFVTAVLTIIAPSGTQYDVDLIDLSAGFPSSNVDFEYTIPSAQIGSRTNIEDGYWQFIYTINDGVDTYIASKTSIFTCNAQCCVNSMLLNIDAENSSIYNITNNKRISEYIKAKAFLDSLKYYAFCGNLDKFTNIKKVIDKICAKSGCKTCN